MKESTHRNIYTVMENGKVTAVTTSRKAARKILQKKANVHCLTLDILSAMLLKRPRILS